MTPRKSHDTLNISFKLAIYMARRMNEALRTKSSPSLRTSAHQINRASPLSSFFQYLEAGCKNRGALLFWFYRRICVLWSWCEIAVGCTLQDQPNKPKHCHLRSLVLSVMDSPSTVETSHSKRKRYGHIS